MTTNHEWIQRNFTIPACRGKAVTLAHAAFQAGIQAYQEYELGHTMGDLLSFEEWMEQEWESSE